MTKTELLSTYTAEQLAEMVVAKNDEIQRLKRDVSRLADENGELQTELDKYNNYILPRCTKEAKEMIDRSRFGEVMIVTYEEWGNKKKFGKRNRSFLETIDKIREYTDARAEDLSACGADLLAGEVKGLNYVIDRIKGFELEEGEIEDLKELIAEKEKEIEKLNKNFMDIFMQAKECTDENLFNINRFERQVEEFQDREEKLQSEVEKYRKAFEGAKKERDCQIAEYQKKIDELYYSLRTLEGNLKVSNVVIEETIKNENGEESNTVKFDSIKQFAEYVKCFYTINLDYIQDVLQGHEQKQSITKNIADFLPTEPIKVADILINEFSKGNDYTYHGISELRQIAEHLLVYCNHNGGVEEWEKQ